MFNTKDIIKRITEEVIVVIKSKLDTDSRIYNKIEYKLIETDNQITSEITAPDYFKYIDEGRKPNSRFPPRKAIADWVKRNNIPTEAIFPIQRSIAKNGIEPKNIMKDVIKFQETNFTKFLEEGVLFEIQKDLTLTFRDVY